MGAIADFLKSGQKMPTAKTGAIGEYLQEQEAAKHVETPRIGNDYNKLFGTASNPNPLQIDTATANKMVATARQLPKIQPITQQPQKGAIQTGLDAFNAYSRAFQDPFVNSLTLGGSNLTKKAGDYLGTQLFGTNPAIQNQYNAQQQQLVPQAARNALGMAGNVAGSVGAFGGLTKAVGQPLANLVGKVGIGKLGQAIASNGATMGAYEGINSLTQGNGLAESAKRAGQGVILGAVAGPAGEYLGNGVKALVPGAVGHYAGNALSGAATGLGFSYGGNLMNGQPLNNAEAGKNAAALAVLSAFTGGRYRRPFPEPIKGPELSGNASFGPNLKPDPNAWTVDATGNVRTPQTPIALLPAGKSVKFNRYTMQPFLDQRAERLQNVYDQGVVDMQNQYGHWDIHPPDVYPTAQKAGVNLENMFNSLQRSENIPTTSEMLNNLAPQGRMARVVGLKDIPTLKKPEPLDYYGVKGQAVMQNKGIRRVQPIPKANIPEPLPQANTGANGGVVDTRNKIVTGKQSNSTSLRGKMENLYTRTVDTQYPISKFTNEGNLQGLTPKVLASNSRNSQGITSHIFETGLVNKEGQQIGESYKNILKAIPKNAEKDFADYLLHKHNVDRMAQEKPVFGNNVTADTSMAKVAQYEALHPEFKQLGDRVNNFIDATMKTWGVDSGLLTPEQYQAMKEMYPNYVPTYRSFSELEKGSNPFGVKGKSFVGQSAGIKKATGSERPVIDPLESVMGLVDKTVKAAKYNEVGQNIVQAIKDNPEGLKKWAEIVPTKDTLMEDINKTLQTDGIEGVMAKFNEQFDRNFNKPSLDKDNIVRVMENGQPIYLKINDKSFLDAVKGLAQSDLGTVEKAFRKGTGVFKALITGKNPIFGIRNIARDIPTAYINGGENNPAKFLVNLLSAGKDIVTRSPQFKEYKALGGGQGNFFAQDTQLLKKGGSLPSRIGKGIEAFNNLTETAPRYAEYKRTVKQGGGDYASKQQGLYNANEVTTNFSRNGDIVKSIDSYVPYMNASFEGLDKIVRQFKDHPIGTILKGATIITAPTLLLNHVNKDDPNYKAIDNRTKDNYFLIPNGDGTFFKLPKSRELGVLFGSLTERILRTMAGEKNSFKGFGNTVSTNFAPANPIESNFFSPIMTNIPSNKDFANRTIVPQTMQDRSPKYQYDDQTSEIGKKIGELTNLSPKQIDYLISSYTGVIGQLGLPAATKSNYQSGNDLQKALKPITKQFTADPLYSSSSVNDFYDNYDQLKQVAADKNFTQNIPSKLVTPEERTRNAFLKASKEMSALTKQIKIEDQKGNTLEVQRLRRQIIGIAVKTNQLVK